MIKRVHSNTLQRRLLGQHLVTNWNFWAFLTHFPLCNQNAGFCGHHAASLYPQFQLLNQLTDFHKFLHEMYAI